MDKTKITKLNTPIAGIYAYVSAPADYDAAAITHEDAQQDSEIQCFAAIEDVAAELDDEKVVAILDDESVSGRLRECLEEGNDLTLVAAEADALTFTVDRFALAAGGGWLVDADGDTTWVRPWDKRQAEEWIQGAVSGGAVEVDEATHEDLVALLTTELTAEEWADGWCVVDASAQCWWPDAEAQAEIAKAQDPGEKTLEICQLSPMRGEWRC